MRNTYLTILFTAIFSSGCISQQCITSLQIDTLTYDLYVGDKIVGEMNVFKTLGSDSVIEYLGESSIDFRMLFKINLDFLYKATINSDGDYSKSAFT